MVLNKLYFVLNRIIEQEKNNGIIFMIKVYGCVFENKNVEIKGVLVL